MHTIGIDMSKDSFHAALDDQMVKRFANDAAGIQAFMKSIENFPANDTRIGVEATGVYHLLFATTLRENSRNVFILNPLESHRMITQGLRPVKTDRLDALKIRAMVGMGKGYPFTDSKETIALKALALERQALVEIRKSTKQRVAVHRLKEAAAGIVFHDGSAALMKVLDKEIKQIERSMAKYEKETQKLLQSIPGIGGIAAAALVAFVGDINRFAAPEKLVAYIGLDSRVYQSGTSVSGKGYISKRGNSHLRHTLFNAAFVARQHVPDLKRYHEKKLREGKHYFSAMCAVERKLIHLIYAVWKRGTPYCSERPR